MKSYIWEKLFSEKTHKKDGKFLLPREWTRLLKKNKNKNKKNNPEVNEFSCITFNRHSLSKRVPYIFSAPFCTTKGNIYLHHDTKLVINHFTIVQYRKNQHVSLKSHKVTGSKWEAFKTSLLDCPFPKKEYQKNLSQFDDCNFNAGSICDIGNSKAIHCLFAVFLAMPKNSCFQ